jgi:hypothetical protein
MLMIQTSVLKASGFRLQLLAGIRDIAKDGYLYVAEVIHLGSFRTFCFIHQMSSKTLVGGPL